MPGSAFALVDAFVADRAFSGNPAGVVLLDDLADSVWMQGVANELAQAETAFLAPANDGTFRLRWFTPVAEVALCGHATLAAAHRLWETGALHTDEAAVFSTRSGRLTAMRDGERILLDFPAVPASELAPSIALLAALAGTTPVWTGITSHSESGERNVIAVLQSEQAVRELVPDLQQVALLPAGGLIVTARRSDDGVVSRYFAPVYGIPEDPVTGSAHCTVLARPARPSPARTPGVIPRWRPPGHHDRHGSGTARRECANCRSGPTALSRPQSGAATSRRCSAAAGDRTRPGAISGMSGWV